MALKHRVSINITGAGGQGKNIIAGAERRLPSKLLRFLFGGFTQVYRLSPEIEVGGTGHGNNERAGSTVV